MKGGLQECAEILDVERVGYQHQAGSDSYVTGRAFFRMLEVVWKLGNMHARQLMITRNLSSGIL